jgi:hypothetical protein
LAVENGGTLVSYSDADGGVTVTVRVDGTSATARAAMVADDSPGPDGPPAGRAPPVT